LEKGSAREICPGGAGELPRVIIKRSLIFGDFRAIALILNIIILKKRGFDRFGPVFRKYGDNRPVNFGGI